MSVSSADRSRTGRALAASAESLLMPVLDELKVIASVVSTHFAAPPVPSSRLEELRDRFETLLERPGALASGAGYLAAPGTLADVNLFEAWWERDGDAIVPHSLDFDRLSEEFYDYSTKDFYLLPASTSLPCPSPAANCLASQRALVSTSTSPRSATAWVVCTRQVGP